MTELAEPEAPGAAAPAPDPAGPAPRAAAPAPDPASRPAAPAPARPLQDPDSPYPQLSASFKRAMVAVRRMRGRETHRPGQLSYAQYSLLFGLAGMSQCSAKSLAEHADLTPATVAQMLESLESAGLVTRTRSAEDRRVVLTALTDRGRELVAERHALMAPRWQAALSEFNEDELLIATRVLNRLADYFDQMAAT